MICNAKRIQLVVLTISVQNWHYILDIMLNFV